jgi:TonB-linked SusC/RagA family outer membrane protein
MESFLSVEKQLFLKFLLVMKLTTVFILVFALNASADGFGQQAAVTGKVTGENDKLLSGVSIQVKGTNKGTTTNAQGVYSINVSDNDVLVFSYVGYETQEIAASGKTEINVSLALAKTSLEQVVVIGYGTANKRDLTGSIVKVDGKELADKPNVNPISSLQGKVAGLYIVNSGTPGAQPDIRIRGTISIGSVHPVYVVDGILNDNIDFLNPNDIESIEILKDPSSLAIFGVKGAAGAIVITTKRAKAGQMQVNFNSIVGFKKLVDKIKLTNAEQFKTLYNEQLTNEGGGSFDFSNWTANTDWIDALSQTGIYSTNNISVTGSSERNRFYMNAGYTYDEGMVRHERLEKILLTVSDEFRLTKNFRVGFNFNGIHQDLPYLGPGYSYEGLLSDARHIAPVASAGTINGVYSNLPGFQSAQISNPAMVLENLYNKNFQREYRTIFNVFAELTILKNFTFRATGYGDITNGNSTSYSPIIQYYLPEENDTVITHPYYNVTSLNIGNYRIYKWQQDNILTFKKNFGDHGLTITGGSTVYYESQYNLTTTGKQSTTGDPIPNIKRLWNINNALVDASTVRATSSQFERTTASWLARMLYNYKGKYLVNASLRNDGTSGFKNNPNQYFWAVGGAWELTKENFMQNQHLFDFLKLKGSIGVLGNQNTTYNDGTTNPYPSYAPLTASSAVFGNTIYPAYAASYEPDPNLKWETVHAKEVGIELNSFHNRLHFEAAYYDKVTKDLLAIQPAYAGFPARLSNIGSISNKGVEFSATWNQQISKDFSFSVSANLTTMKNKVISLYTNDPNGITGADEQFPNRTAVGKPIGFFYGFIAEGVYQNQEEVDKSPVVSGFGDYGPGDLKFKDIDGNDTINAADRTMIGNPTPDFTYGVSFAINYKGFDLGIDLQGVSGNQIYRYWGTSELTFAPFNYPAWKLNRWHGAGTSNTVPQINNTHNINSKGMSTFGIEKGSYLRIRNLQLGYNFSANVLRKANIKSFKIFVSAQNIKTFKDNVGYTPDFPGSATSFGIDVGNGPLPAIYTAGVNVTF